MQSADSVRKASLSGSFIEDFMIYEESFVTINSSGTIN